MGHERSAEAGHLGFVIHKRQIKRHNPVSGSAIEEIYIFSIFLHDMSVLLSL